MKLSYDVANVLKVWGGKFQVAGITGGKEQRGRTQLVRWGWSKCCQAGHSERGGCRFWLGQTPGGLLGCHREDSVSFVPVTVS